MNKKDLIALRDEADETIKPALRWAINRIEALENQLLEVHTLAKITARAAERKEN